MLLETANSSAARAKRDLGKALGRGFRGRCPHCGEGHLFGRYLKVNDHCEKCGEAFFHQRADDAPPYVTIFVVGHVVVAALLVLEDLRPGLPMWLHMALWPVVAVILSLGLLPAVKGALINLQWALRMHGFGDASAASDA